MRHTVTGSTEIEDTGHLHGAGTPVCYRLEVKMTDAITFSLVILTPALCALRNRLKPVFFKKLLRVRFESWSPNYAMDGLISINSVATCPFRCPAWRQSLSSGCKATSSGRKCVTRSPVVQIEATGHWHGVARRNTRLLPPWGKWPMRLSWDIAQDILDYLWPVLSSTVNIFLV